MHIGIVSPEFPPDFGGVETYAYEYAKALSASGYQVSVYTLQRSPAVTYDEEFAVYPVLKMRRRLDKSTLASADVDAWHVMNAAHSWLALETNKPVVVSIHGNDFLNPYPLTAKPIFSQHPSLWRIAKYLKPFEKWLGRQLTKAMLHKALPKARIILSNSSYTESIFLQKFPECKGKTLVAQVGVGDVFLSATFANEK